MSTTWLYTLVSVLAVSLVSLIGVATISMREELLRQAIFVMVSLAVGAMFGDTFIHLLPESFQRARATTETAVYILAGIFTFFVLEKFLLWRHDHAPQSANTIRPIGYTTLIADGLHNFIDGLIIGASYLVGTPIGLATTIAVLLHEVPHEIGNFGILLHAGFSKSKALWLNFLSATLAIVGALVALVVSSRLSHFSIVVLPITAGGFIYLAGCDLVPELHKERKPLKSLVQLIAIGIGVLLMLLLKLLE